MPLPIVISLVGCCRAQDKQFAVRYKDLAKSLPIKDGTLTASVLWRC
jgi:hypothetical protein